ncbi:MAG: hypothetical protein JJ858_19045 [Rhizobiaceae bacterium]|nr:hypothetical protein [Rhizobiaceae bacterium]
MDDVSVAEFFRKMNLRIPSAKEEHAKGLDTIQKVVFENHFYTDKYLEAERSFFEILLSLSAVGMTINDPKLVEILGRVIDKKTELTGVKDAWHQYEHLARWLIHLARILDLKSSPIEDVFLSSTLKSMTRMSREKRLGYSWHAFNLWSRQWSSIKASNRMLIKDFITENTTDSDALYVVRLAV